MACGNRGVDRVERGGTHDLEGLVEVQAVVLYQVNQALQVEQSGMTLVAMVDVGLDAEALEQQHAANAQEVFLLNAVLPVTTIEFVGDFAVIFTVLVDISVKQVEFHASHVHHPHIGIDGTAGIRHLMHELISILVKHWLDGKLVEILRLVVGNLLAIHCEGLGEIAVTVKETHCGHVDATVAGLLDVVTGKDAEASRVNLQGVAQTVLHAEVSHRGKVLAQGLLHVLLVEFIGAVDACHHSGIGLYGLYLLIGEALQHLDGILAGSTPSVTVEVVEEGLALGVPCPPQIA